MADTSTFPTIHDVIFNNGPTYPFISAGTIKRGMFVAIEATGTDWQVVPALQNTGHPVGVALDDADSGAMVPVALQGCIVTVCEGAGAAIDAGSWVQIDDCAVGGTVTCYDPAIGTHAATLDTPGATGEAVGLAVTDIAANGTGQIIIAIAPGMTASS